MADWLIQIVATGSGSAAFLPVQPGGQRGGALRARNDDTVIWRNMTGRPHHPWPTDDRFIPLSDAEVGQGIKLSDEIPPRQPSAAAYNVALPTAGTIYYCCKLHPEEHGTIIDQGGTGAMVVAEVEP